MQSALAGYHLLLPLAALLGHYPSSTVLNIPHTRLKAVSSLGKLTGDERKGDRVDATTTTAIPSWGRLWTL